MHRNTAMAVGFLIVIGVVLVVLMGKDRGQGRAHGEPAPTRPVPSASASASAIAPSPAASVEAAPPTTLEAADALSTGGFDLLPDGRKAPPLPATAPKEVQFGVVLLTYQGAEGAPKDARTKEEARKQAEALIVEAKQDFAAAVAKGDPGSAADQGKMLRDMLEPAVEYQVFTLDKGEVSNQPIDTPKGYWIVRRNR